MYGASPSQNDRLRLGGVDEDQEVLHLRSMPIGSGTSIALRSAFTVSAAARRRVLLVEVLLPVVVEDERDLVLRAEPSGCGDGRHRCPLALSTSTLRLSASASTARRVSASTIWMAAS